MLRYFVVDVRASVRRSVGGGNSRAGLAGKQSKIRYVVVVTPQRNNPTPTVDRTTPRTYLLNVTAIAAARQPPRSRRAFAESYHQMRGGGRAVDH